MTRTVTVEFLGGLGIDVRSGPIEGPTAVPGIAIAEGGLVVDPDGEGHEGDLLHEAGHLALLPPSQRAVAHGTLGGELGTGLELGAICWSVAAAWHLDLELSTVFHADGYRDDSTWLIATYEGGSFPGLPLLQWAGLTWAPGAEPAGEVPFPAMRRWLRTTELPE